MRLDARTVSHVDPPNSSSRGFSRGFARARLVWTLARLSERSDAARRRRRISSAVVTKSRHADCARPRPGRGARPRARRASIERRLTRVSPALFPTLADDRRASRTSHCRVSRGRAASGHNTQPSSSARCVGPTLESRKGTARVASSPTESSGRDDGQTRGRGRGRGEAPRAASRQRRGRPGGGGRGGDGRPARRGQRSRRRGTRGPALQRRRPRGRRPAARPRARQEPGEEHALPRALPQGVPGQVREPLLRFPPPPAHNPRQGTPHPRPFGSLRFAQILAPPSFIFARLTPPPPPSFHPATPGPNPRKTPPPSPRIPTTWTSPRRC